MRGKFIVLERREGISSCIFMNFYEHAITIIGVTIVIEPLTKTTQRQTDSLINGLIFAILYHLSEENMGREVVKWKFVNREYYHTVWKLITFSVLCNQWSFIKNSVKLTFLTINFTVRWFHEIFSSWGEHCAIIIFVFLSYF